MNMWLAFIIGLVSFPVMLIAVDAVQRGYKKLVTLEKKREKIENE